MSGTPVFVALCRWPECTATKEFSRRWGAEKWLCPDHTNEAFCGYCLRPVEPGSGKFCSDGCRKRDLDAFAVEADEDRPAPSADQESLW